MTDQLAQPTASPLDPPTPIVVKPSAVNPVLMSILGAALVVATGIPTLLSFVKAWAIINLIVWLQSQPGLGFLTAAGFLATMGWSSIAVPIIKHRRLVTAARAAPDSVAVVIEDGSGLKTPPNVSRRSTPPARPTR